MRLKRAAMPTLAKDVAIPNSFLRECFDLSRRFKPPERIDHELR
jgi:hypothetical protein